MDYETGAAYNQQDSDYIKRLKKSYHIRNILSLLQGEFSSQSKISVLEFGPGLGVMAELIRKNFPNSDYSAVDIDNAVLDRLKKTDPEISVGHISSSQKLTDFIGNCKYDIIIALDVWEHLPEPELIPYTKKCVEVLKTNGILILQVPNWGCPFAPNVIFAGDITHKNPFNEISAVQLLMNCGVSKDQISILPYQLPKGIVNLIRKSCRFLLFCAYKLILGLIGLQVLKICTPNLIIRVKNS